MSKKVSKLMCSLVACAIVLTLSVCAVLADSSAPANTQAAAGSVAITGETKTAPPAIAEDEEENDDSQSAAKENTVPVLPLVVLMTAVGGAVGWYLRGFMMRRSAAKAASNDDNDDNDWKNEDLEDYAKDEEPQPKHGVVLSTQPAPKVLAIQSEEDSDLLVDPRANVIPAHPAARINMTPEPSGVDSYGRPYYYDDAGMPYYFDTTTGDPVYYDQSET